MAAFTNVAIFSFPSGLHIQTKEEVSMFNLRVATVLAFVCASPMMASANPDRISCEVMAVLSTNDTAALAPLLDEIASRWITDARVGAVEQLSGLIASEPFVGGSVHRLVKLGEDLEEHVILLRLREGEVAGMRMRYEWSPDGLTLAGIDFKRQIAELTTLPFRSVPETVDCPS